jgi:hypothetical protein
MGKAKTAWPGKEGQKRGPGRKESDTAYRTALNFVGIYGGIAKHSKIYIQ